MTPLGLMSQTWPLADRRPRICEPLTSAMRFTAMAAAPGWTKLTLSCAATLKLLQLSSAVGLACWTVVVAPLRVTVAVPATTLASCGAEWARASDSESAVAVSTRARRDLPWPRAFSAQATQAQRAWFQTRRYVWFMLTR